MCGCDYGKCKEGCDCRCHISSPSAINNLAKAIGTMDAQERKNLTDEIQRLELQIRELKEELDEYRGGLAAVGVVTATPRQALINLFQANRDHHDEHHRKEEEQLRLIDELRLHLKFVCNIAGRLGPSASNTHREEALQMLDGTIVEAEAVWRKSEKRNDGICQRKVFSPHDPKTCPNCKQSDLERETFGPSE